MKALVVVITAVLLGIRPLSAIFCLESTERPTSSATISRIEVAQNEWVPSGSPRFVGTLMLPDAKDNVLTADGHFLRKTSKLATNRRGAIAACRVQKTPKTARGSQLTQRCSSSALTTLRLEKACQARAINRP
ncbi:hypothetical protein EY688_02955 [Enterococcus casseliflavus]|nr:hypothetical protein [Enterococcus casseliflavus]MBO6367375.1 hypothetical protein [Enterococcus casseliflavus]MBX9117133.1 hypothetical protein [Enterococcus casseliflavus]MBX9127299.1 hypothetical protein [Enterococcus casseliflavus]